MKILTTSLAAAMIIGLSAFAAQAEMVNGTKATDSKPTHHERKMKREELPENVKAELKEYKAKQKALKESLSPEAKEAMQKRRNHWKKNQKQEWKGEHKDRMKDKKHERKEMRKMEGRSVEPKAPEAPVAQ